MSVYTQLHQITDAMGRNIDLDPMIDDCIAGMQERDLQNDEPVRSEGECREEIEAAMRAWAQAALGKLSVDTTTIPADAMTEATITYTSMDPVAFIVDGEAVEKIPNDVYAATLTVAADAPGFIEVRIPGVERVVTITVTEVV